ncbi:MarR family winged helix-turn-helix transcriptional regulator [Massilia genomosp. 1]|uniref:MarR family transcriptional regulator n=1 Tax=Massilia genomosp. 1 TaxID=2609280 RepID=A0ABX0N2T5_9BURK|nr:MarR family winged helix-turn-helix transcriptional regulator [Massilia genomosp. 1]NHZ66943.1 MarR family transcriptional regulator [Massilia genomosp. 1]
MTTQSPCIKKTPAGTALTEIVLLVFRLDGALMDAAEKIAAPAGLTAARWRVLGAVLSEPRTVADIARNMGVARQSVQRLSDALVAEGLLTMNDNPAHKTARLATPTPSGRVAIANLSDRQTRWANLIGAGFDIQSLDEHMRVLKHLIASVEKNHASIE